MLFGTPRFRLAALVFIAALIALAPSPSPGQARDPKPLKIQAYGSLFPGVDPDNAQAASQPACNLIGAKVGYPLQVEVYDGKTADDLLAFGKRLADPSDDSAHLGGLWGLEYGWLAKANLDLEPLTLFMHGDQLTTLRCILVARRDKGFGSLKDLKGKKLAQYDSASLMVERGLAELFKTRRLEQKDFFVVVPKKPLSGAKEALFAVRRGEADCVMVTESDFMRLASVQPEVEKSLMPVERSLPFPLAGLFGSKKKIDALQSGLWKRLTAEFPKVHETAEGRRCVSFWRFNEFVAPHTDYSQQVRDRAVALPLLERK